MPSNNNLAVIYVDAKNRSIHYYSAVNGDKSHLIHDVKQIKERLFTQEYYNDFTECIKDFVQKYTPANAANTTVVVSDQCVFTNCATFPALKGPELKSSLDGYLINQFKNYKNIKFDKYMAVQNKQYITFCLTGIQTDLLYSIKKACNDAKIVFGSLTFAANATAMGLVSLNPKLKAATYLFLDCHESTSKIVYVFRGRVVGFFDLPFGYNMLISDKMAAEDVLMYEPSSELAVLNAKEKAKQKALTLSGQANVTADAENLTEEENAEKKAEGDEESSFVDAANLGAETQTNTLIKTLPKKVARKLPKFMQREVPEDDQAKVAENFRIYTKWILDILNNNEKLTSMGKLDTVYVNMPESLDFLYDLINAEAEENKVKFVSAGLNKEKEDVTRNLEMYGGFYSKSKGSINF